MDIFKDFQCKFTGYASLNPGKWFKCKILCSPAFMWNIFERFGNIINILKTVCTTASFTGIEYKTGLF